MGIYTTFYGEGHAEIQEKFGNDCMESFGIGDNVSKFFSDGKHPCGNGDSVVVKDGILVDVICDIC